MSSLLDYGSKESQAEIDDINTAPELLAPHISIEF